VTWRPATLEAKRDESATARTLVFDVAGWPGHEAGQHVDVRLTAPDGYSTTRSYSIGSASDGTRVELTVERVADGEVSPYLIDVLPVGGVVEFRGPVGGWFVWRPIQAEPVSLVAGGSGVVPLMAMLRTHANVRSTAPMRLLYSVRDRASMLYAEELASLTGGPGQPELTVVWTRAAPPGAARPPGRIDADIVAAATWPSDRSPQCYVCGPTPFVEAAAGLLVSAGHDPRRIRTERFGPTGGGHR
jgi:ferredoxin-NADP reductase